MCRMKIERNPIDIAIGTNLRRRRIMLKKSMRELGDRLNISYQQVSKYELGANRISASDLWALAKMLDVPVTFFYDGILPQHARN